MTEGKSAGGPNEITEEDAFHVIVKALREGSTQDYGGYGYNVYLPNIVRHYLTKVCGLSEQPGGLTERRVSPAFLEAAWELARRLPNSRNGLKNSKTGVL